MARSARTGPRRSVNRWLDARRPWQYALVAACTMDAVTTGATILFQWLLHGHLDPSAILGTVIGTMAGSFTIALAVRLTRSPTH